MNDRVTMSARLTPKLADRLRAYARERGMSITSIITLMIEESLDRVESPPEGTKAA